MTTQTDPTPTAPDPRPCPEGAVLSIRGETFPCDMMNTMVKESPDHQGWPHGSTTAEAIWDVAPKPSKTLDVDSMGRPR